MTWINSGPISAANSDISQKPSVPNLITRTFGLLLIAAAIAITATNSSASEDTSEFIFLLSLVFAYVGSRRTTPVLSVYVLFVALWFFLPSIFGLDTGQPQLTKVWLIAALWLFAWTGGQLLFGPLDRIAPDLEQASHPHNGEALLGLITIGSIAMLVQAQQFAEGISGYMQQISGVTDTSLSGDIATTAGPALIAAFIIAHKSSSRRLKVLIISLIVIEAIFLTQGGGRGAALEYLVTGIIAYMAVYPPSISRERRTLVGWLIIVSLVGLPLTLIASNVRQNDEANAGYGIGQNSLTFLSLPQAVLKRIDETANLGQALGPLNPQARSVVAMTHQLENFVPRPLWPGKPIFNYGEQVSSAIFGLPADYRTASTITWLGDLYLNGGLWAVLVAGVVLGSVVWRALRRAVRGGTLMIIITVPLVSALFSAENPIILGVAAMLRTFILLGLACLVARLVRRKQSVGRFTVT